MNKIVKNALILAAITLIAGLLLGAGPPGNLRAESRTAGKRKTGILSERIPGGSFL